MLLAEWDKLNWRGKLNLRRRSASAFWDALWLQPHRWEDDMFQDLRYGVRMLIKSPGFTAVAVLSLALGIGANTAIFSLMEAVLLRSLPVPHPEQLVLMKWDTRKWPGGFTQSGYGGSLSYTAFRQLRSHSDAFSSLFGFAPFGFDAANANVNIGGRASLVDGVMVTGGYFSGLGVQPILGREISEQDETAGSPRVAVLGYDYWVRTFGRDPKIVGQSIVVNGAPCAIVGVAPSGFFGVIPGHHPDLWVSLGEERGLFPFSSQPPHGKGPLADDTWFWLQVMGRLKPGISEAQARASLDVPFQQFLQGAVKSATKPEDLPHITFAPGGRGLESLRRRYASPLSLLQIMVAMVLLIGCANLAALLLARAAARRSEMGVRMALGASRARLIRQLLIEGLVLSALGGASGLLVARWGAQALLSLMASGGQPVALNLHLDLRVLAFAAALAVLTSLLFGLAPAFRATRVDLVSALKETPRGGGREARSRARHVLVCAQVAISLVLLTGAGLFLRTLENLHREDLGFSQQHLLLFGLDPTKNGYDQSRLLNLYGELLDRLETIPGVRSATASALALISGWVNSGPATAEDAEPTQSGKTNVLSNAVGPRFCETMGIRLLLGRDVEKRDLSSPTRVAVVNESLARGFWPGQNPVGRRLSFGDRFNPEQAYEVIGVAQDAKFSGVREKLRPTAYFPYSQTPWRLGKLYFELRAAGDTAALIPAIRSAVRATDPNLPLFDVKTQAEQIDQSLLDERLFAKLSSFFGLLALLLSGTGLYGLLSYSVSQQTHDIGIRLALGAQPRDILRFVLKRALWTTGIGIVAGVGAALGLARFVRSFLFGIEPSDPWTLAGVALLLAGVALLACWIPARRATQVDPMVALRCE